LARLAKPLLLTTVDWVSAELRLLGSGPTPVIELCMFAQERQAVADCSAALGSHYLRLNRHPSGEQIAAAAFDSATQASTDILIGLADQEFDAIRGDKARLGRLLQMLRP
jgi:hypothetical protein